MPKLIVNISETQLPQVIADLVKHRFTFTVKCDDAINNPVQEATRQPVFPMRKQAPHKKHVATNGAPKSGDIILNFLKKYPGERHQVAILGNQLAIAGFKAKTASSTLSYLHRNGLVKREPAKSATGLPTFVYWVEAK